MVIIHPCCTRSKQVQEDFYLTNLVSDPLDTCLAATRLILYEKIDQLLSLWLALAHEGFLLPYQIGCLDYGYA